MKFLTEPAQGLVMLTRALDAGVAAQWVTADEAYGKDGKFRAALQRRHVGYVLAVACNQKIATAAGGSRADGLTAQAPDPAWKRRSCDDGVKGRGASADPRSGSQPWLMYPFVEGAGRARLRQIPVLPGLRIYAVPQWNGWLYVGKTEQTLTERLDTHLRDPDRVARWVTVMTILLNPAVSTARLGQRERAGRNLLAPRTGSRWSTGTPVNGLA